MQEVKFLFSWCKKYSQLIIAYMDGLVQDFGNSSALAMVLPQSCAKPLI